MAIPKPDATRGDDETPELTISPEKVCFIILKAREFDVKDAAMEGDPVSNATDDLMLSVLEDRADDPVEKELRAFIFALSEDEQVELVALMWLGRNGGNLDDWTALRAEAARAHANHPRQTADYLLGEPLVSDYLEEGLSLFEESCAEVERDHL